jgi:hypothetical protein
MKRLTTVILALIAAVAACGPPIVQDAFSRPEPATVEPALPDGDGRPPAPPLTSPPAATPKTEPGIEALIDQVSSDNLMMHLTSLSNIPTRHVNSLHIGEAASYIYDSFAAAGGRIEVTYDEFPLTYNEIFTTQRNVIATLPGSDPAAGIVIVGAHYDSRTIDIRDDQSPAPGADDNASGVAALIELARLSAHEPTRATIVLIAFSAEEVGTWGSKHYVELARQRGDDIRAVIALDIIGNSSGLAGEGAIRIFSAGPNDSSSRSLACTVALTGETYLPGFDVQVQPTADRPDRYSDHIPFSDAGCPAVRLIEAIEDVNHQHSQADIVEHLSPTYLRRSTQLTLASIVTLANGPDAPVVSVDGGQVSWQPVDGAAGYIVAFRQSESLEFEIVSHTTGLTWNTAVPGWVSVAAVDLSGTVGVFSTEAQVDPQG